MLLKCCTQYVSNCENLAVITRLEMVGFLSLGSKKGSAKECSNCRTTALISHATMVMLSIFSNISRCIHFPLKATQLNKPCRWPNSSQVRLIHHPPRLQSSIGRCWSPSLPKSMDTPRTTFPLTPPAQVHAAGEKWVLSESDNTTILPLQWAKASVSTSPKFSSTYRQQFFNPSR